MRALLLVLVVMVVAAVSSFAATGSSSGPREFQFSAWIWHIANFSLFSALLYWFYNSKLKILLRANRSTVQEHIKRAGAVLRAIEVEAEQAQDKLNHIDQEASELLENYRSEGTLLAKQQLEDARIEAKSIELESERRLAGERRTAEEQVRNRLLRLSIAKAEEKVRGSSNQEIEQGLRNQAVRAFRGNQ